MDPYEDRELIRMYDRMIRIMYACVVGTYCRYRFLWSDCIYQVKMTAALKGVSSRGLAASDSWRLTIPRWPKNSWSFLLGGGLSAQDCHWFGQLCCIMIFWDTGLVLDMYVASRHISTSLVCNHFFWFQQLNIKQRFHKIWAPCF